MHGLEVVGAEGAAATGDTAADLAVVELELRHGQALFGFVRRQGLTDTEAEDAVQEVLVRLWLEIRAGRAVDNPRAWAYRSVYRIAMDSHRLHRRVAGLMQRLDARPSSAPTRDATDQ